MKIKYPYALCSLLLMGSSTPSVHAAVDLLDVAFVAILAVMGALCAHEIPQKSVDKTEERLDMALLFKQVVEKNIAGSQDTKVF